MESYNKLVRNKIPEMLNAKGVSYEKRIASPEEYKRELINNPAASGRGMTGCMGLMPKRELSGIRHRLSLVGDVFLDCLPIPSFGYRI